MKLDYSFHSHTFRCNHAIGDIEDYVPLAIKNGYKIYGLSDHVFLPGVVQPRVRGNYELLDDYIIKYNISKKLHEKEIEMHLGFECEYSDVFTDYYKHLLKDRGVEYLICGQHCYFNNDKSYYGYSGSIEDVSKLKEDMIKAMQSGLFLYIAHPDIAFLFTTEINDLYKEYTKELIAAAIKYDAVLEINRHGLYRNHHRHNNVYIDYPCEYFWKEVAKTNIKVVAGGDFHDPKEIDDKVLDERFNDFIEKCHIKLSNIKNIYLDYQNKIKQVIK